MNIDRIELAAATGHWIYTNASHMDYYRFYKYNFAFSNEPLWKTFDNGTFTLLGHYLTKEIDPIFTNILQSIGIFIAKINMPPFWGKVAYQQNLKVLVPASSD